MKDIRNRYVVRKGNLPGRILLLFHTILTDATHHRQVLEDAQQIPRHTSERKDLGYRKPETYTAPAGWPHHQPEVKKTAVRAADIGVYSRHRYVQQTSVRTADTGVYSRRQCTDDGEYSRRQCTDAGAQSRGRCVQQGCGTQ